MMVVVTIHVMRTGNVMLRKMGDVMLKRMGDVMLRGWAMWFWGWATWYWRWMMGHRWAMSSRLDLPSRLLPWHSLLTCPYRPIINKNYNKKIIEALCNIYTSKIYTSGDKLLHTIIIYYKRNCILPFPLPLHHLAVA